MNQLKQVSHIYTSRFEPFGFPVCFYHGETAPSGPSLPH